MLCNRTARNAAELRELRAVQVAVLELRRDDVVICVLLLCVLAGVADALHHEVKHRLVLRPFLNETAQPRFINGNLFIAERVDADIENMDHVDDLHDAVDIRDGERVKKQVLDVQQDFPVPLDQHRLADMKSLCRNPDVALTHLVLVVNEPLSFLWQVVEDGIDNHQVDNTSLKAQVILVEFRVMRFELAECQELLQSALCRRSRRTLGIELESATEHLLRDA